MSTPPPHLGRPRAGCARWRAAVVSCVLVAAVRPAPAAAQEAAAAPRQRAVLLLEQGDPMRPAYVAWTSSLRRALIDSADGTNSVVLFTEALDLARFGNAEYRQELLHWLGSKYAGRHIDVLVVSGPAALKLVLELRPRLWPDVPLVATSLSRVALDSVARGGNLTGLSIDPDVDSTLAVARALVPNLRYVAITGDASTRGVPRGLTWDLEQRAARGEFALLDLRGLPMPELRRRVAALPEATVVYDNGLVRDDAGVFWVPIDALQDYAPHSRAPILSAGEAAIGVGATAGWAASFDAMGRELGVLVRRVMAAGSADSVPRGAFAGFRPVADSRALARYGIPESRLPPGTEFRFRRPSLLALYWRWALGGLVLLVLQSGLILALLAGRRQRRRAQRDLEENLQVSRMVAEMEASFRHVRPEQLDDYVDAWLERLAHALDAERAALGLFASDQGSLIVPYRWAQPWIRALPPEFPRSAFPGTYELVRAGRMVAFSRASDGPPPATADHASFSAFGTRSLVIVPLFHEAQPLGCLTFSTVTRERDWPLGLRSELQLAAGILASAIGRERATAEALKEEAFTSAMIATAASRVAIVNRRGTLVRTSDAWAHQPDDATASPFVLGSVGEHYPGRCREVGGRFADDGAAIAAGIEAVLHGRERRFALEYAIPAEGGPLWYAVTVERFDRYEGGAVVAHLDVTERHRAERAAEAQRSQLEHSARVAEVTDLAAAIAHELNQPLAAILANAQAAARLIERTPVPLDDLREILGEIQDDDRRAAEIIGRIRGQLRKELEGAGTLDLNEVVRGVQRLLAASAARRGVRVRLELAPEPMLIVGDRVQLEQVLINLLTNAFDAVSHMDRREVLVTTRFDAGGVEAAVADSGAGIDAVGLARMFEPFYTTKAEGLGLGLSIVQSIVEAAGGTLEAANRPEGGAVVRFTWPAAEVPA